mmetsp:Transcript_643/g.2369  ORF Transcript_643/g.2369 Transcript_643/m.2369 type:complete len:368 (-) Transcript_643:47-1150(-)
MRNPRNTTSSNAGANTDVTASSDSSLVPWSSPPPIRGRTASMVPGPSADLRAAFCANTRSRTAASASVASPVAPPGPPVFGPSTANSPASLAGSPMRRCVASTASVGVPAREFRALKASSANSPTLNKVATTAMETNTATYPYSAHLSHPFSTPNASRPGSITNQSPAASMSSLYPRSSSQSTPNVMPVSAAWIARRYSVFCDGSKVLGSTPLRARRTGATTPAVRTNDAVQPESPKKTRHPPHGTSHRSRTVSRSKNLSSAMSSSPLDDASALGVPFAALSAMDPGWDGGIGTPLRRRKLFSFSSSSTPPPAARSASRPPRALAGDEARRHPSTSKRVRHVRVTRVARRGTETPTDATIEIDAIAS